MCLDCAVTLRQLTDCLNRVAAPPSHLQPLRGWPTVAYRVEDPPCETACDSRKVICRRTRPKCLNSPLYRTDANNRHTPPSRLSHCWLELTISCIRWPALAGHHQIVRHLHGGRRVCGHNSSLRCLESLAHLNRSLIDTRELHAPRRMRPHRPAAPRCNHQSSFTHHQLCVPVVARTWHAPVMR